MDAFRADMKSMFDGWLADNTDQHKYYQIYLTIRDRYERNIARAEARLKEIAAKGNQAETASAI